jgi:hypothetical protein
MEEKKEINELDAQLRLADIMNDAPRKITLGGREFEITALKPGTQYLIAAEATKIAKTGEAFADVIKQFAVNIPAVIRCITLAILNDKDKINGAEYQSMYDFIQWETKQVEWMGILVEILQMLNLEVFFYTTEQIDLFRQMTTAKKTTVAL